MLSDGYKVLWLAHTHHLLEQAFRSLVPRPGEEHKGSELAGIAEPRESIAVRVVSGTKGHFPVHQISGKDDVVIATLQTIAKAYPDARQKGLRSFLDSAKGKLAVVFDEAHHSPAPSYRRLLEGLRDRYADLVLLGLTATPTYSDEKKSSWLEQLFPQKIVHQSPAAELFANGTLAKPLFEEVDTHVVPAFDQREYEKWVNSYQDLPEQMIKLLAENRERNAAIAEHYVKGRERYGKAIIFADRWIQCDMLREMLRKRGVRADAIYSHVERVSGGPEDRQAVVHDDNHTILDDFKRSKLDVLINVRMLTEGTDVPDVKTVFLTRQTRSRILLTQMVGRALRGPKAGGTEEALVVCFFDRWQQAINWATWDQLSAGGVDDTAPDYSKRPPLQLISIDLIRRLARMMDSGILVNDASFLSYVPLGWYQVEFEAVGSDDDAELVEELVMVFEHQKGGYDQLISHLVKKKLATFADETLSFDDAEDQLAGWADTYFPSSQDEDREALLRNLFPIGRHIAQSGVAPTFVPFADRRHHDLDGIALPLSFGTGLNASDINKALQLEYSRTDRFWRTLYPAYQQFKTQYDACVNHLLSAGESGVVSAPIKVSRKTDTVADREPSTEIKEQVKKRDGYRCLCCGEDNRRFLQVDHRAAFYYGGTNSLDNLQTLCKVCNGIKGISRLDCIGHRPTGDPPEALATLESPAVIDPAAWQKYLRRLVNLHYGCSAVLAIKAATRGQYLTEWEIELYAGNEPSWLRPHLKTVRATVNRVRKTKGKALVQKIRVVAPGARSATG